MTEQTNFNIGDTVKIKDSVDFVLADTFRGKIGTVISIQVLDFAPFTHVQVQYAGKIFPDDPDDTGIYWFLSTELELVSTGDNSG